MTSTFVLQRRWFCAPLIVFCVCQILVGAASAQAVYVFHACVVPPCSVYGNVTKINTKTNQIEKTILMPAVGKNPDLTGVRFAASHNGKFLYVAANNIVTVIDTVKDVVLSQITAIPDARSVAISNDDQTLYVGSGDGFVGVLDATYKVIGYITRPDVYKPIVGAWADDPIMVMSRDGKRLYASNLYPPLVFAGTSLSIIDTATNMVIANLPTDGAGADILTSPDGKLVYFHSQPGIAVIDAVTNTVVAPTPTSAPFFTMAGAVLSSDGKLLFLSSAANMVPDAVFAISAIPNPGLNTKVLWTIPTPKHPVTTGGLRQLTVSPDNKFLYVIDSLAGPSYVYVIDIAATATIATITLGPPVVYTGTYAIIYVPAPSISISINTSAVTLSVGETQQLTAFVSNDDANAGVIWSLSGPGTISPSGLYTAPSVITSTLTVTIKATSVADPTKSSSATITLTPPGEAISTGGIVNAASRLPGPVAAGEILTISGSGFGPQDVVTSSPDSSGVLPTVLAGARVLFDGVASPILCAASGQVSAIVPYALDGNASTQVQVEYQGQRSNPVVALLAAVAPGIFTLDSTGAGQAVLFNEDGSQNSPSNPASAGSTVVFYATGTGVTGPPGIDGQIAQEPLATPIAVITVHIAGMDAEVLSASAVTGSATGLVQVKVRLPANSPTGDAVQVDMYADGIGSQPGVTLAIR
jgi:uncharacterized protein (TIGR03437 family)